MSCKNVSMEDNSIAVESCVAIAVPPPAVPPVLAALFLNRFRILRMPVLGGCKWLTRKGKTLTGALIDNGGEIECALLRGRSECSGSRSGD